jgi:hypothetical protein
MMKRSSGFTVTREDGTVVALVSIILDQKPTPEETAKLRRAIDDLLTYLCGDRT